MGFVDISVGFIQHKKTGFALLDKHTSMAIIKLNVWVLFFLQPMSRSR